MIQKSPIAFPAYPPSTPRIYTTCMLYHSLGPDTQGRLTFKEKLKLANCNRLLFTASLAKPPSPELIPVVVKFVSGDYDYGEDVHHLLATNAPAYSSPEGGPRAYVMEYLPLSSWKTLFDYSQLPKASTPWASSDVQQIKSLRFSKMVARYMVICDPR